MTQIDFYVLTEGNRDATALLACRLCEKAIKRGNRVYINASDHEHAKQLNEYFWSFEAQSFIPHALADKADAETPVCIGFGEPPAHCEEVLINLAPGIPAAYARFERVLELVPADHQSREALRASYAHYRERGYPLKKHDITL